MLGLFFCCMDGFILPDTNVVNLSLKVSIYTALLGIPDTVNLKVRAYIKYSAGMCLFVIKLVLDC